MKGIGEMGRERDGAGWFMERIRCMRVSGSKG
jgi:hypothetical protein